MTISTAAAAMFHDLPGFYAALKPAPVAMRDLIPDAA
jgi:hypothetical protein